MRCRFARGRRCRSWSSRTSPGSSPSSGGGSRRRGSRWTPQPTAATGLRRARERRYDLVVLDLLLPGARRPRGAPRARRRAPELPVLILSARADLRTKLRGFELGARDYVAKPFSLDELHRPRARAASRASAPPTRRGDVLRVGPLELDFARRQARGSADMSRISRTVSSGCSTISSGTPARSISREQLLEEVWGYHFDPGSNVVDVCIRRLRKKLGAERRSRRCAMWAIALRRPNRRRRRVGRVRASRTSCAMVAVGELGDDPVPLHLGEPHAALRLPRLAAAADRARARRRLRRRPACSSRRRPHGTQEWGELTEVPLMSAMFLAMVWHARRRQQAARDVEPIAENRARCSSGRNGSCTTYRTSCGRR